MAGSEEDSLMDLFRPLLPNEDLLHVAKTLASHTITVDVLLLLSESAREGLVTELFPTASVALKYRLKAAISSRNIPHGSSSTPLMEKMLKETTEQIESLGKTKKMKRMEKETTEQIESLGKTEKMKKMLKETTEQIESLDKKIESVDKKIESLDKTLKRRYEEAELERKSKKVSQSDDLTSGQGTGFEWSDP